MSLYGKKPAFGAVRSHMSYAPRSIMQTPSAVQSRAMNTSLRMNGLGSTLLSNALQEQLLGQTNDLFAQLDEINALLDEAARTNVVDANTQAAWLSRMDEVASGAQRLVDRVGALDDTTVQAWHDELTRLVRLTSGLRADVSGSVASLTGSKVTTVAIWTGVGVFGAVGLLLTARWWINRKKGHRR